MSKIRFALFSVAVVVLMTGGCPWLTGSGGTIIPGGTGSSGTGSSGTGSSGSGSGGSTSGGSTTATYADQVLTLVNTERANAGLGAVTRNSQLDAAAAAHAADMYTNNFFAHEGSDGSQPWDRATTAGYVWSRIGENIGQGNVTPNVMMDLWMNSPDHRANILDGSFTEIGIAVNNSGTTLWVQDFGRP